MGVDPDIPPIGDEKQSGAAASGTPLTFTAKRLLIRALQRRRILVFCGLAGAIIALVITLVPARTYSAKVSLLPASSNQTNSSLAGLASQIGIDVGSASDAGQSPDFYSDYLVSDRLLHDLAISRYTTSQGGGSAHDTTLVDYLTPGNGTPEVRAALTVIKLRKYLTTEVGAKTGVVTLRVKLADPVLAQAVAARALDLVNTFNIQSRKTQAGAQRLFLQNQLDTTLGSLRAVEDSLLDFLLKNRNYQGSPTLSFQNDRLQRRVSMLQDAHAQVFQALLQAEATEAQNTPVVTVVEPPTVPVLPDSRRLLLKMIAAALVAFVLAITWLSLTESVTQLAAEDDELALAWSNTRADWGRLWSRRRRKP